ncbi:GNAT family N-acetyltransferase [Pseudomonas sp. J452]|uniref:GNAT family N-acetyltransferase n=1 Tax=Pseudomonas sp. J452 TaxID=2898441 RepID=UPI0021ADA159|nr:GNAT family N-acetyltransferase [Pseudomonas sp. J452]UUY06828.1 GNAT family N-acetyltransferase [Pseudomonas sp. J452]
MPSHSSPGKTTDCNLKIRRARPDDAQQLASLLKQLGHDEQAADSVSLARQLSPRANREVLVAERDNLLLGTCTLHLIEHLAHGFARSAIIEDMVVDSAQRGRGIGRALMLHAIDQANLWDCYKVGLSSAASRQAAHHFYRSLGFEQHGISLALNLKAPL